MALSPIPSQITTFRGCPSDCSYRQLYPEGKAKGGCCAWQGWAELAVCCKNEAALRIGTQLKACSPHTQLQDNNSPRSLSASEQAPAAVLAGSCTALLPGHAALKLGAEYSLAVRALHMFISTNLVWRQHNAAMSQNTLISCPPKQHKVLELLLVQAAAPLPSPQMSVLLWSKPNARPWARSGVPSICYIWHNALDSCTQASEANQ